MKKVRILTKNCNNIALEAVYGLDFDPFTTKTAVAAIFPSSGLPGDQIEQFSVCFLRQIQAVSRPKTRPGAEKLQQSVAFFTKTHFFVSNISPRKNNETVVMKIGRG